MSSPYLEGYLEVSNIHSIYYSCWGNPTGTPILLIHGGPGYGSYPEMLDYLDFTKWNIIMYDQRGCGKSIPIGCIDDNTTPLLIEDIKQLLDFLGHYQVVIKGSSWGTTLAVAFAEKYPQYVRSMILVGFFNGTNVGTLLGKNGGFEKYYPDIYADYISGLSEEEQVNPYYAYCKKILNNSVNAERYARKLVYIESLIEKFIIDYEYAEQVCNEVDVCSVAKLETYYTINDFFMKYSSLLDDVDRISNIPISIIHGRFDLITPSYFAWEFAQKLPLCDFHIVEACGHDIDTEEGILLLKDIIEAHYKG